MSSLFLRMMYAEPESKKKIPSWNISLFIKIEFYHQPIKS